MFGASEAVFGITADEGLEFAEVPAALVAATTNV
jgi:hypothetical protein